MSHRGDEIVLYDGGDMPFESNSFDGALCIEVLEHARDPDVLLSEIHRVMKPGAVMLLTVPWSARRHHIPHDFHRFTKERLEILFAENGFTDVAINERGNDYCAIANKLLVVLIRNLRRLSPGNFIFRIPLIAVTTAIAPLMLLIAHLSLRFRLSESEDPLGYACRAVKA
jgi:SAM-dependent methyltransferase